MTVVRIRILRRVGADGQDAILDQYSRGACARGSIDALIPADPCAT